MAIGIVCGPTLTQDMVDDINSQLKKLEDYHISKGREVHGIEYASVSHPPKAFDDMSLRDINRVIKSKGDKARSRKEHRHNYRI